MNKLTLTEEQMVENLHLAVEEVFLQAMILNRRAIAQVHFNLSGHIDTAEFRVMPFGTKFREGLEVPDPLAELRLQLDFYDWMDLADMDEEYRNRLAELETFVRYLDHLIAMNKQIPVNYQEAVA